jgi:alkylation response protein AidB-like acyl-CoA dehydrogenase
LTSALLRNRNSSERVSTSDVKRKFHWRKSGKSTRNVTPKEIIKEMADLGFLMMTISKEHGGTGAEGTLNIQRTIIARELLGKKYIPYRWASQTLFP